MKKHICSICGYVYDPAYGDPEPCAAAVPPGTAWENVPEDWICPVCGVDKACFDEE